MERLKSSMLRMKNKIELVKLYDFIIQDQLAKGVMELLKRLMDIALGELNITFYFLITLWLILRGQP